MHPNNQLLKSEVANMLHFQLYSARYTVLQTKNSEKVSLQSIYLLRKIWVFSIIAIQYSHREAIPHYCELTPCVVSEKNWDTKEDKNKSMMHALYTLQLAKRHVLG